MIRYRVPGEDLPDRLRVFHADAEKSPEAWLAERGEWAAACDWMVGPLVPFAAPEGTPRAVWDAFVSWDASLAAISAAHPEDATRVEACRWLSAVPDEPWDASDL